MGEASEFHECIFPSFRRKGLRRCFTVDLKKKKKAWTKGEKNTSTETSYIGQFNYEWHWPLNRESVWWFGGRGLLLEEEQPLWSLGERQVFLPAQCTFVARWLSSSDWLWQGVRAGSKWRAFSMISCQPSLITPCLYLSLVCPHNLFLSLLIQFSLYPPENFFSAHTPHFPLSLAVPSVFTFDLRWGVGFWWGPIKAYNLDYVDHMCFTMLPLKLSWGSQGSTAGDWGDLLLSVWGGNECCTCAVLMGVWSCQGG